MFLTNAGMMGNPGGTARWIGELPSTRTQRTTHGHGPPDADNPHRPEPHHFRSPGCTTGVVRPGDGCRCELMSHGDRWVLLTMDDVWQMQLAVSDAGEGSA